MGNSISIAGLAADLFYLYCDDQKMPYARGQRSPEIYIMYHRQLETWTTLHSALQYITDGVKQNMAATESL